MGIFAIFGFSIESIVYCALFSILLVISIIDFRHHIIPNGLVITITILGLINLFFDYQNWLNYIIGFFSVSMLLLFIAILSKGKMGGGDIKLMAAAGLLLGFQKIILALMIGSILGSIIGLTLIVLRIISRKQMIPFGPFLSFGIITAALFGKSILIWYFTIIT